MKENAYLEYALDLMVDNLSVMPEVNNGACCIVADTIAQELPDMEVKFLFLSHFDNEFKEKNFEHFKFLLKRAEQKIKNNQGWSAEEQEIDELWYRNDISFIHIMLEITSNNEKYLVDGRGIYSSLEDKNQTEVDDFKIAYETSDREFIHSLAYFEDFYFWRVQERDDPEKYVQDLNEHIQHAFKIYHESVERDREQLADLVDAKINAKSLSRTP